MINYLAMTVIVVMQTKVAQTTINITQNNNYDNIFTVIKISVMVVRRSSLTVDKVLQSYIVCWCKGTASGVAGD